MRKTKVFAIIYALFIALWLLLSLFTTLSNIGTVISSGFSGPDIAMNFIRVMALFIGISMLVPPLREMYSIFPWIFYFVKVIFADLVIFCIALTILNYGFEIQSQSRHILFIIIMIVQIIVCRIIMCLYLKKR